MDSRICCPTVAHLAMILEKLNDKRIKAEERCGADFFCMKGGFEAS